MHADLNPEDAEALIIAAVLMDKDATAKASRYLKAEHFYSPVYSLIFDTCSNLWQAGDGVDLVTVSHALRKSGRLDDIGGAYALSKLCNRLASTAHLPEHCGIVREMHAMRILRDAGTYMQQNTTIAADPEEVIGAVQRSIVSASGADISTDVNMADEAYRVMNEPAPPKPLRLGIVGVDDFLAIYDGNVIVISADSGVGKTTMVWNGVLNVAHKRRVWYVSLEMPAKELAIRTACKLARVDLGDAFQDRLSDVEKTRMAFAVQDAHAVISRIDVEDSGSMSIEQYSALAEHKVRNEGVDLIVVDYLQLMTADPKQYRTEYDIVTAASKCVRRIARTLNVPTIVVSQLSREGQLRSSNQILQDAHVDMRLSTDPSNPAIMKVSFKKNRNGPLGSVDVPTELQYGSIGAGPIAVPYNPRAGMPDKFSEPVKDEIAPF